MATRSFIKLIRKDGSQTSIYCHWDGYIEHNGVLLQLYYNTVEKIEKLLALGDISSLNYKVDPDESKPHTFDNPQEDVVVAYHRDRGEEFRQSEGQEEYNYTFDESYGCWIVSFEEYSVYTRRTKLYGVYSTDIKQRLLIDMLDEKKEEIARGWTEFESADDFMNKVEAAADEGRKEAAKRKQAEYEAYNSAYGD